MNPADAQDVPRAIEFIDAIDEIASLPTAGCSLADEHDAKIIGVIGEMFSAFMDAFICPDWCLTQQVTALSKFSHTSFALFRRHGVNFMPNQLYGDMQLTVKNVIMCIAKQKELDHMQLFYTFWTGDDKLEATFGLVRMQGGHNPNCTLKQLIDHLAASIDLTNVFARHPTWNSGSRRLKITRTEHADHLNPESWRGMVAVSSVDLYDAWTAGREDTLKLLDQVGEVIDFESVFSGGE